MSHSGETERARAEAVGWLAVTLDPPPRGEELLLAEALRRIGGRGVQEVDGRIEAYLPPCADPDAIRRRAEAAVRGATSIAEPRISVRRLRPDEERSLWYGTVRAVQISDRLMVAPTDEPLPTSGDQVVVRIAPGPAFGSAQHPTTRSCLQLLEKCLRPGDVVLDLGTGSGILAIAAALLGAERVVALEADQVACAAARGNVATNGAQSRVEIRHATASVPILEILEPFDGITANIDTGTLLRLLPTIATLLEPGGWLLLSGIPQGEAPTVFDVAAAAGLELLEEALLDGWWTGRLHRS